MAKTDFRPMALAALTVAAAHARAEADLTIRKEATPDPVVTNRSLEYRLTVTNRGPDTAEGVTVVDSLPPGFTPTISGECNFFVPNQATCDIGRLEADESFSVELAGTAPNEPGVLGNVANVSSDGIDPVLTNNGAFLEVTVVAFEQSADIALRAEVTDESDGGVVTVRYTVDNNGPSDTSGVELAQRAGALRLGDLVSVQPSSGTCTTALEGCVGSTCDMLLLQPLELECALGTLPVARSGSVLVALDIGSASADDIVVDAEASSSRADPFPDNNTIQTTLDAIDEGGFITGDGCSLSLVASGTALQRRLPELRRYRDRLCRTAFGRRVVVLYYRACPHVNGFIRRHPRAASPLRGAAFAAAALVRLSGTARRA